MGLMVSVAFYNTVGFGDVGNFLADIAYRIIIELVARKYEA